MQDVKQCSYFEHGQLTRCQCVLAVLQKGCGYHLDQGVNVCWLCYRKGVGTTWTKVSVCVDCVTERVWVLPGPRCQCVLAVLQKGCGYHLDQCVLTVLQKGCGYHLDQGVNVC